MSEQELFAQFREMFMIQNPQPRRRKAAGLGWEFWSSFIWCFVIVVGVASRTASQFYKSEILSGLNESIAFVSAAGFMFGVEGGLVVVASIKAARGKGYDKRLLNAGIAITLFISMVAGVGSSMGELRTTYPDLAIAVDLFMTFALGVCGSVVAWIAGEVMGAQVAFMFADREKSIQEYNAEVDEYNQHMLAKWSASDERKIARKDTKIEAIEASEDVRSVRSTGGVPVSSSGTHRSANRTGTKRNGTEQSYGDMVYRWLEQNITSSDFLAEEDVPSAREIARKMNEELEVSNVDAVIPPSSADRGRKRWMRDNLRG